MKGIIFSLVVAAVFCWKGVTFAQSGEEFVDSFDDDYLNTFGEDPELDTEYEGPRTLTEAIRTGRGYRIGAAGVHRRTVPEVYTVREGDTLWDITERYYGDPWQWPKLWSYNPEITNPHWIYPLDRIRLAPIGEMKEPEQVAAVAAPQAGAPVPVPMPGAPVPVPVPLPLMREETAPVKTFESGAVFLRDQGYLDQEALRTVGEIVGGFEEQMFLSDSDIVYLKFEPGQEVKIGQQFTFFREIYDRERDPGEEGILVRVFGTAVVNGFDPGKRVARAVITETLDPIERGFKVAYMERRFDLVPARPNKREVVAKVVAAIRPRSLLSYNDVVFLDVGEDSGIEPGNRFFIMRREDNWQESIWTDVVNMGGIMPVSTYDRDELPEEAVAELRVIKVRKKTTIAYVTRSDTDIFLGDRAEMRKGF